MAQITTRPSPLACRACREKHLKCDALTPMYPQDSRGRIRVPGVALTQASKAFVHVVDFVQYTFGTVDCQQASTPRSSASSSPSSLRSEDEHLINLYYANFHPHHPMLVPRSRYQNQNYPEYLQMVMKFIGSQYAPNISSDTIRSMAAESLAGSSTRKTPEMVQASLLYSMSLHARYEPMEAMTAISKAADTAIELRMYETDFAIQHGHGDSVYEESLRRTWWELYIADGYLASLHRQTSFKSNSVEITTLLPCDDEAYDNCTIPSQSFSLENYDGRLFADEDWQFSSAAYRIDAIRILARVIAVSSANEVHADSIQSIDNAMASWKFHIPNDKAGVVLRSGEVDQMMFQAFLFIYISNIFLHFPRSELPITMPASAEIACARRHMEQVSPTSSQHAAKALSASKELANLASLPGERYSPFFICGLVFACVVQLSACSAYPKATTEPNRERVALILGVLKSLSRNWSIAQYVSQQLKKAAHEIFHPRPETASVQSAASYDSGIDMSGFAPDMSWFDMFYSDGMQGLAMGAGELTGI
ncbi:hypothetical protein Slin15195_G045140 [Septoria linicola]|uniref:Xylanolytic transcriptional activator regulatory domain-containing protein n=1 Tax=Septoria linicola TaxID=215465 RepID=A0A9Q9EHQ0_9PEZI|nr:hypothetical protein Slin14017_G048660 [Septoria linicola]USW51195.1 hypothetical protein Slin15195_G045140 [Septoria linicola]